MADISYVASTESAKNQMNFQREMSSTAHQREVADLKAAGLNPVLSAHTQGASTPTGAEGDYGDMAPIFDALAQAMDTNAKAISNAMSLAKKAVDKKSDKESQDDKDSLLGLIGDRLKNNKDKGLKGVLEAAAGWFINKYGEDVVNTIVKPSGIRTNGFVGGSAKPGTGFGKKFSANNTTMSRGNGRNTSSNPIATSRKNVNTLIRADLSKYTSAKKLFNW